MESGELQILFRRIKKLEDDVKCERKLRNSIDKLFEHNKFTIIDFMDVITLKTLINFEIKVFDKNNKIIKKFDKNANVLKVHLNSFNGIVVMEITLNI